MFSIFSLCWIILSKKFTKILIFILFMLNSYTTSAQYLKITDPLPDEISRYLNFLTSYSSIDEFLMDKDTMSIDRLKYIVSIINAASERDAFLKHTYYDTVVRKSEKMYDSTLNNPNGPIIPARTVWGYIYKKVITEFPPLIEILLNTDYLIKGKILKTEIFDYPDHDFPEFIFQKVNVTAKIIEVIKGDGKLKSDSEVTFEFLPGEVPYNLFKPEEICLLPIMIIGYYGDTFTLYYHLMGDNRKSISMGNIPIENEIVIDKDNYFGFGQQVPWDIFKKNILTQLNLVRSWGDK